ncbi:MAG TPA: hypothetical protein VIY27_05865, partial [Myxococcota bacterium]
MADQTVHPGSPRASDGSSFAGSGAPTPEAESLLPRSEERSDPLSAMTPRFNLPFRWFARRYVRHFGLARATIDRLGEFEAQGSVVYVMRYASRL